MYLAENFRKFVLRKNRFQHPFEYDVDQSLVECGMLEHIKSSNDAMPGRFTAQEVLQFIVYGAKHLRLGYYSSSHLSVVISLRLRFS